MATALASAPTGLMPSAADNAPALRGGTALGAVNPAAGALSGGTIAASGGQLMASPPNFAEPLTGPLGMLRQSLNQPAVKKALPWMAIAMAMLFFAVVYTFVNAPSYRPIMTGVTEGDQQAVFEALKAGEFKPQIDTSNGQITVPASRYHEARIYLASKGLPKTAASGVDALKDQSAMTTSQFMEQVRYTAAQEQELARSILQIETIQTARVHLAMTKPSVFVRERTPPKASIVVTPQAGRTVSAMQVQAIVHLVASSVPLLTPDNVTVVDNVGKLMTESAADAAMGLNASQTKHKQGLEDH
ncbi:MAG: flagellar basal-body MS-ring/collar protein FliF [Rhodoferax sp.]